VKQPGPEPAPVSRPRLHEQVVEEAGGADPGQRLQPLLPGRLPDEHRYRMASLAVRIPPSTFTPTRRPLQARLPLLSTWPGHVDPKSTYWHLQAVPEPRTLAAGRLEQAEGQAAGDRSRPGPALMMSTGGDYTPSSW
jgi:hypothetical protein